MIISKDIDLLNGSITSKLVRFTIPIIFTNVLQTLFNSADMIVVGLSGVDGAIGSIGTTLSFINLVVNLFIGLSAGAEIVVSRSVGEGRLDKQEKAVHTALLTSVICGFLCMFIGLAISKPMLVFLGDKDRVLELALLYTRIYFLGVPFVALSNFLIVVFRAKGDSKTPMFSMIFSGLLNVVLNLVFVVCFGMSVDGVALATAISNMVASLFLISVLTKDKSACRLQVKKLGIDKDILRDIMYNGIPSAFQSCLYCLANMTIQSSIITLNNMYSPGGSVVIDGTATSNSIENLAATINGSVNSGVTTMVSQHKGACKNKRLKKVVKESWVIIAVWSSLFPLLLLAFKGPLISLFIDDPQAVFFASQRLNILFSFYIFQGFLVVTTGMAKGLGKALPSAIVSLFFMCIFRMIWILVLFPTHQTYTFITTSFPITWILCGAGQAIIVLRELKKLPETNQ